MSNTAYSTVLKDTEGNQIFPKTQTTCVYDENGKTLNELLSQKADTEDIPISLPASDVYDWAKQPQKPSYSADEIKNFPTALPANGGNASTVKDRDVCSEIDNLKTIAVDGKTSVANAINGHLGTKLSNQTTFADLTNYITNNLRSKLAFKEDSGFSNGLSGQWFTFGNTTAIMASISVSGNNNANIAIQTSKKAKILLLGNGETSTFIEPNDTKYYYVYGNGQYNWIYGYYVVICEEPAEVKFMSSGSPLTVRPIV